MNPLSPSTFLFEATEASGPAFLNRDDFRISARGFPAAEPFDGCLEGAWFSDACFDPACAISIPDSLSRELSFRFAPALSG